MRAFFAEGDRVTLMFSSGEDDFPEETGTVIGRSGSDTYVVEVDGHPQSEDGLVEVPVEQMEILA